MKWLLWGIVVSPLVIAMIWLIDWAASTRWPAVAVAVACLSMVFGWDRFGCWLHNRALRRTYR
jgi:hypothetical protein